MTFYAKPQFLPFDPWFLDMPEDIKHLVEDPLEVPVTLHETMYRKATERLHKDIVKAIDNIGGSEKCQQLRE